MGGQERSTAWANCARTFLCARWADDPAARLRQEIAEDSDCGARDRDQKNEGTLMKKKRKAGIGSSFDEFLKEEGIYEEVTARAIKRVIARQLDELMRSKGLTKSALAKRMD